MIYEERKSWWLCCPAWGGTCRFVVDPYERIEMERKLWRCYERGERKPPKPETTLDEFRPPEPCRC